MTSYVRKILLLTYTLMGEYAEEIFYLLFRILTRRMPEEGYRLGRNGSLTAAAMRFMHDHGVLKEVFYENSLEAHKPQEGKNHCPGIQSSRVKSKGHAVLHVTLYCFSKTD
ncbi:MAG: hypothetical protein G5663_00050 [Serratia symbiotica]|nr:hypothetical protein [Serratia symbiotica]